MTGIIYDLKNIFKNFKTVYRFAVKAVVAYFKYARTNKKRWGKIGYIGPRPQVKGKLYDPPEEIIKKKIVMDCPKRPPAKPVGIEPDDPENPFQKSPFHNYEYEKQMEEKNRLLKENIKDIKKYKDKEEVDILIIGSGPGGAALAHTLSSKLTDKKIVVLEEGKLYTSDKFTQKETDLSFYITRFSDDFGMDITQGRMIGGAAVLNDAICFELPAKSSETWDQDVAGELKKGNYYEKVRSMIHYKRASKMALSKNARVFLQGVEKMNKMEYSEPLMRNTHGKIDSLADDPDSSDRHHEHQLTCVGCGFCPMGCKYNRKQTPLITYIPAAIKNGVKVFKNAAVSKILYEKKNGKQKVTGVRVKRKGLFWPDLKIKAKIVVASCGAISSAQLLLKSRIENPYLGKNISAHTSIPIFALFKDEDIHADWGIPMCASYDEFQFPKGIENKEVFPDGFGYMIESVFNPPFMTALSIPKNKVKERMKDYKRLAKVGIMLRGNNEGELKKRRGHFSLLHYKLTESEKNKFRHGIRTAANIYLEAGADEVFTNHEKELLFRKDHKEEDLKKADTCPLEPGDLLIHTAHPQGGCKMGNPGNGVVDFNGHSYDVQNLFVCDASLFPTSLGVNPQLAIMALATKIGEHMAANIDNYI